MGNMQIDRINRLNLAHLPKICVVTGIFELKMINQPKKSDNGINSENLGPVEKFSIKERVYQKLRGALMLGQLLPGKPITIQDLADTFGTSHMPVREALRRLVSEQALVVLPNRSLAVPELTLARYNDLLSLRKVVEGAAAGWAASSISDAELERISILGTNMQQRVDAVNSTDFLALHQDFHFSIYRASRNASVLPIIEILWLQIGPYHNLMVEADHFNIENDHHDALLDALRDRNSIAATQAVESDLEMFAKIIRPQLNGALNKDES
jgi:DNA-binding GntR family transcriptional regulator